MMTVRDSMVGRYMFQRVLTRWRQLTEAAETADAATLRRFKTQARQLRREADRLLQVTEGRLLAPGIADRTIPKPPLADWCWRPLLWRGPVNPSGRAGVENRSDFGDCVTVFHDCTLNELTLRQVRNAGATDLAPFGLRMEVLRFKGSFLSLVIDLPNEAMKGLRAMHVIRLELQAETERPVEIFARLNIKCGPNTGQIVRELQMSEGRPSVEFDLSYANLNDKRFERAWLDLIFEGAEMNQITLRDLTLCRRPRAEL